MENITELGKFWQEEIINLSDIPPENLDALENRIQDVLHRLGKAMMKWKLKDWNSSINKDKSKDKCPKCDSKVHNRKRTKQILTTVATIDYERYMSYCPKCKHAESSVIHFADEKFMLDKQTNDYRTHIININVYIISQILLETIILI